jgi:hypothetical protein
MSNFLRNGDWLRWLIPICVGGVIAYSYAMKVPDIEKRTQTLEKGQAVLETKVDFIVAGIEDIKGTLKRRR